MEAPSVRDIIECAGGPKGLASRVPIKQKSIYCWFEKGIPEKHWAAVISVCGVTLEQLHRANEALRRSNPRPPYSRGSSSRATA
jgi:hypothetical protein